MLGIILIYIIGKNFYRLSDENNKNNWAFAILGVVSYYATAIVAVMIFAIFYELYGNSIDDVNEKLLDFMSLPFGIGGCYLTYKYLEKKWEKKHFTFDDEILDRDMAQGSAY